MSGKQLVSFGEFEFDLARGRLFRARVPVPLGKRGAALLAALLTRRGEVLEKAELLDAAWPDVIVEESNLTVQIALLRRALGKTAGGKDWIITVQRTGYRFMPALPAREAMPVPALAILPFNDFGTGAEVDARSFTEDLTAALSRFKSIGIVAHGGVPGRGEMSSAGWHSFRRHGVCYVLEGSVRRTGGGLRVHAQLIDCESGSHIWAETLAAGGNDPDRLVELVAATAEARIQAAETARSRADRAESMSAYDLMLRARWHIRSSTEPDNAAAYRLLQRALRQEPENIHILAAAAETVHHRIGVGWSPITPDDRREVFELAQRGIALGIDDGAALGLFSNALFTAREWDQGRVTMERAVEANPNSTMGLVCAGQCSIWLLETDRAQQLYERAAELGINGPNRRFIYNGLAVVQRKRGNYEAAVDFSKRALAAAPGLSGGHWNLIASTVLLGRRAEAQRYMARYRAVSPTATVASILRGQPVVDERVLENFVGLLAEAGLPEA